MPKTITLDMLTDVEVEGVLLWDEPRFCDAYIDAATFKDTGIPLTSEEIESISSTEVHAAVTKHMEGRWDDY